MSNKETYQYRNNFNREKYDRVGLMLPRGQKDIIKAHAAQQGESVNGFITRAIAETIVRDNEKTE